MIKQIVVAAFVMTEGLYARIVNLLAHEVLYPSMLPVRNIVGQDNSLVDVSDILHSNMIPSRKDQHRKKVAVPLSSTPIKIHQMTKCQKL